LIGLKISETLTLPLDFVAMTAVILARKGSGKTYTSAVLTEEMLEASQQVVIVDPVGVWWGLKSSADGKAAGFPIAVFGGDHADIDLEPGSGQVIAEAIVRHGFSCILDLSLMSKGEMARFSAAFLESLYRLNRNSMHLVVDEADAFAPQRTFGVDDAKMLGAMQSIVRRGRARGIGVTMITQRPQVLNKDVLTQADVLIALRLSHPKDIDAIEEWVNVHAEPREAKAMVESLPSMPTGTAWVWGPMLKIFEKVQIRRRATFDSSATPKPGEKTVAPRVLAPIDMKRLGEEIAQTAEEQQANSPEALRRRIAELERAPKGDDAREKMLVEQIQKMEAELKELRSHEANIQLAKDAVIALQKALATATEVAGDLAATLYFPAIEAKGDATGWSPEEPFEPSTRWIADSKKNGRPIATVHATPSAVGELTGPQTRILEALGRCLSIKRARVTRPWVAFLSGASPKSSAFTNNLGALRSKGFLDYENGLVYLTDKGRKAVPNHISHSMSQGELHDRIIDMLPSPQGRILNVLLDRPGKSLDRPKLAELAGASPTSSAYTNNLGAMRSLGLIDYGSGSTVFAKQDLFI
jgi:hypothetical protein